jgi:hemoglobin
MAGEDIAWGGLHPETRRLLSRRQMLSVTGKSVAAVAVLGGFLNVTGCSNDKDAGTTAGAGSSTSTTAAATPGSGAKKTLYERLGKTEAITLVIADFVDENVAKDSRINTFFAKTDLTRLKKLLVEFVASAAGGPEKYTGRDMVTAHKGLEITMADFNALVEDLVKSLDKFKVPAAEKQEVLDLLGPLGGDGAGIVTKK